MHNSKRPRVPLAVASFSEHRNSVLLRCATQNEAPFPDGDVYVVRHDRLFAILELGSHSPASAPRQAF